MSYTLTQYFKLRKPVPNTSFGEWGTILNQTLDLVDNGLRELREERFGTFVELNHFETGEGISTVDTEIGKYASGLKIRRGTLPTVRLYFDEADDKWKAGEDGAEQVVGLLPAKRSDEWLGDGTHYLHLNNMLGEYMRNGSQAYNKNVTIRLEKTATEYQLQVVHTNARYHSLASINASGPNVVADNTYMIIPLLKLRVGAGTGEHSPFAFLITKNSKYDIISMGDIGTYGYVVYLDVDMNSTGHLTYHTDELIGCYKRDFVPKYNRIVIAERVDEDVILVGGDMLIGTGTQSDRYASGLHYNRMDHTYRRERSIDPIKRTEEWLGGGTDDHYDIAGLLSELQRFADWNPDPEHTYVCMRWTGNPFYASGEEYTSTGLEVVHINDLYKTIDQITSTGADLPVNMPIAQIPIYKNPGTTAGTKSIILRTPDPTVKYCLIQVSDEYVELDPNTLLDVGPGIIYVDLTTEEFNSNGAIYKTPSDIKYAKYKDYKPIPGRVLIGMRIGRAVHLTGGVTLQGSDATDILPYEYSSTYYKWRRDCKPIETDDNWIGDGSKSEHLRSLITMTTPPGAIMAFGMSIPPNGWIPCDGSAPLKTMYPALFAAIGTTWGNAGGDETRFNVPNLHDMFLRGNSPTIAVGTPEDDVIRDHGHRHNHGGSTGDPPVPPTLDGEHTHQIRVYSGLGADALRLRGPSDGDPQDRWTQHTDGKHHHAISYDYASMTGGDIETRPKNKRVMYCIKY